MGGLVSEMLGEFLAIFEDDFGAAGNRTDVLALFASGQLRPFFLFHVALLKVVREVSLSADFTLAEGTEVD